MSDTTDRPILERYERNGLTSEPFKFNHQQIKKLHIGDQVNLSVPQTGQAYDMELQRVTKHQHGTRKLNAKITNTTVPYRVVVTEGSKTTFATVNTPESIFSFDATGEQVTSRSEIRVEADTNWLAVGREDYDGLADLLTRNSVTGQ